MIPIFFAAAKGCSTNFLGLPGLPTWYKHLTISNPPACNITFKMPGDLLIVGLNIVDMLLFIAGIAAIVSIIMAGFEYVFSIGNSDKITGARKRIQNAAIGLAIVLIASGIVSFTGSKLGG